MVREIEFRGQRVDNGEWVYGSLNIEYDGSCFISYWIDELIEAENNYRELKCKWHEVKEETVSQFTGLLDKNGNKIFEGDVIDYNNAISGEIIYSSQFCRFEIVHKEPRKKTYLPFTAINIYQIEIIGNIHEDGDK